MIPKQDKTMLKKKDFHTWNRQPKQDQMQDFSLFIVLCFFLIGKSVFGIWTDLCLKLLSCLIMWVQSYNYLVYNTLRLIHHYIIYFVTQIIKALAIGSSFIWPLWNTFIIVGFFIFLVDICVCFLAHLYFLLLQDALGRSSYVFVCFF